MRRVERSETVRRSAAVILVVATLLVVAGAIGQFRGWFKSTVPVTVVAPRAGLVMNPDAKVKLRGVEVGRVKSISEEDGHAVLKLAVNSGQLDDIPGNVKADIKSNTIFGAKAVFLTVPESGPSGTLKAGTTIGADHVTVELNTVYQRLVDVLAMLQPDKLNAAVGAISTALDGNGEAIGRGIDSLSKLMGKTNPHLGELTELITQTAATIGLVGAGGHQPFTRVEPSLLQLLACATLITTSWRPGVLGAVSVPVRSWRWVTPCCGLPKSTHWKRAPPANPTST